MRIGLGGMIGLAALTLLGGAGRAEARPGDRLPPAEVFKSEFRMKMMHEGREQRPAFERAQRELPAPTNGREAVRPEVGIVRSKGPELPLKTEVTLRLAAAGGEARSLPDSALVSSGPAPTAPGGAPLMGRQAHVPAVPWNQKTSCGNAAIAAGELPSADSLVERTERARRHGHTGARQGSDDEQR